MLRTTVLGRDPFGQRALCRALDTDPTVQVTSDPACADVIVLDLPSPVAVPAVLERLEASGDRRPTVALAGAATASYALDVLLAGAAGFVLRDRPLPELVGALRTAAAGGVVIDPSVAESVVEAATSGRRVSGPYGLTGQELRVVGHLPAGRTYEQIGAQFGISRNTVKTHLRNVFRKLGVQDREEAAAFALQHGLC